MRRFAGFLVAAMLVAGLFGDASRVDGRDDAKEKKYGCAICDDAAYQPSDSRAMVCIHAAGLNNGSPHRTTMLEARAGSAFVFVDTDGKKRICTAWHVIAPLEGWVTGFIMTCLWNKQDTAAAHVAWYDETSDLAVLDFADPDYVYPGDALTLGDSAKLKRGDRVTAIGAPEGHCFMESHGRFLDLEADDNDVSMLRHLAKTNRGNSGGPVLNADGEVVGISIAIHADKKKGTYYWSLAARVNDLKELLEREKERNAKK